MKASLYGSQCALLWKRIFLKGKVPVKLGFAVAWDSSPGAGRPRRDGARKNLGLSLIANKSWLRDENLQHKSGYVGADKSQSSDEITTRMKDAFNEQRC